MLRVRAKSLVVPQRKMPRGNPASSTPSSTALTVPSPNSSTVLEAGLQDLTQEVASCLVHFGTDTTQTWLLVRLKNPDMSKTPQSGPVADDSRRIQEEFLHQS
jgi:hypothetical protein